MERSSVAQGINGHLPEVPTRTRGSSSAPILVLRSRGDKAVVAAAPEHSGEEVPDSLPVHSTNSKSCSDSTDNTLQEDTRSTRVQVCVRIVREGDQPNPRQNCHY